MGDPAAELLQEGLRSYPTLLVALREFRRELREAIRKTLNQRVKDLAAALFLDAAVISGNLAAHHNPDRVPDDFDGSWAVLGWKCERREQPWTLYVGWYVSEETRRESLFGGAYVSMWLKPAPRERALAKLKDTNSGGWETDSGEIYVTQILAGCNLSQIDEAFNGAIDKATVLWSNIGGIAQFLTE